MIRAALFIVIVGLGFLVGNAPVSLAQTEDACKDLHAKWSEASGRLQEKMDACRRARESSLAERIEGDLARRDSAMTIARAVQAAVKERSLVMRDITDQCREAAAVENAAFKDLRRCLGSARRSRKRPNNGTWENLLKERKQLLADLKVLLLDEAYAQYKDYRAPTPPEYSGYGPPWGMGPQPFTGYDPYRRYRGYR